MSHIPVAAALLAIAAATLLAGATRRWLFGWTSVSSHSMAPTLRPGQRLFTLRTRALSRLRRGDIVVLRPGELGFDVIKRVVGLPGDQVHIDRDGTVTVNGLPLAEPYVAFPGGPGGQLHVPPGRFLVLGDNRAASSDSRRWVEPYPPEDALRGRLLRTRRHPRAGSTGVRNRQPGCARLAARCSAADRDGAPYGAPSRPRDSVPGGTAHAN
jgi:signal peptidase I